MFNYNTIINPGKKVIYKDKGSKFYGFAVPVETNKQVKKALDEIKQKHSSAGHFCYAYKYGIEKTYYRVSDDGEPNNSAGLPIYGQLEAYKLTNILIVIVRYFGGTKLGFGGLISAYKTTAKLTLGSSQIKTLDILVPCKLSFVYEDISKVMRVIKKHQIIIKSQRLEMECEVLVLAKKINLDRLIITIEAFHQIKIEILND